MNDKKFFLQLLATTLASIALAAGLHRVELFKPYAILTWISIGFFCLVSTMMYYTGKNAINSSNKYAFTNMVMAYTMIKMFLAIIIIMAYGKIVQPSTKLFILPFFGVYLFYTIFETYFMMKLSKTKA